MFARVEVTVRPEEIDSAAHGFLRRVELAHPEIRKKIRWARVLDVYWIDVPVMREELIPAITEVCWDPVLQWMFTGNLIPSATGKTGSMEDLMQMSPIRPGKFFGIEKRFRSGVTDAVGRTLLEAFQIVLNRSLPDARASSGSMVILEGSELNEEWISVFARELFCNELIETWTVVSEQDLKRNDRFHQERIKYDLPRVASRQPDRGSDLTQATLETFNLAQFDQKKLEKLSQEKLWAFSGSELKAIRDYFSNDTEKTRRSHIGLSDPTDVEMEMLAQTWSEHCKHKIFNATIQYTDTSSESHEIPNVIHSLFKTTIVEPTMNLLKNQKEPNAWLLSVFSDNAGICSFDEEDAFCVKVETHNAPSALDPYGGALTGIVGVNRDILGCGFGAKPIFNTNVFCVAPIHTKEVLPDRILHPRRILEGIRRGVEHGGNKSGIPTINGALVFDDRYLGRPLVYCGTVGLMPKKIKSALCQEKKILPGDRVCMVGGRIGKDGIHGATFSSLAFDENSPLSAVQLGDPIVQKKNDGFSVRSQRSGSLSRNYG